MENQNADFVTIGQIGNKIKRHKWTFVFFVVVSLSLAVAYNYLASPVYDASALISFEQFNNDQMLNLGFTGPQYESNFIANRIRELKTITFARDVYLALPDSIRDLFIIPVSRPADFDTLRYLAQKIQETISVIHDEKSSTALTISFESENAGLATAVTNTAIEVLQRRNLLDRRQEFASLKDFVDEQVQVVEKKLSESETALQAFKNDHNIASLEDESREILTRITQAEDLFNATQADIKAKQEKLAILKNKIEEQKDQIRNNVPETSNPMIAKLQDELVQLEVKSASLQVQGYQADDPLRKQVNTEIGRVKQNLIQLKMGVIQDKNLKGLIDPLSTLKSYLEESTTLEIEIKAKLAEQQHLNQTLNSYNQRLKSLSGNDAKLFELLRDREVNNKIYVSLLEEREQARMREASEIGSMRIIERAQIPLFPSKPRKKLNIIIALLAGSLLGLSVIFIKDSFNNAISNEEEVETILHLPVLASVHKAKSKTIISLNGDSTKYDPLLNSFQDSFAYLWNSLQFLDNRKYKSIMITSATPGEGKSTIATNLALISAKLGCKTLLIDGDLRKPSLAKILKVSEETGRSDLDIYGNKIEVVSVEENDFLDSELESNTSCPLTFLHFTAKENSTRIFWGSPKVKKFIANQKKKFGLIIIDTPPVIGIPDAAAIGPYVDGTILCISSEQADRTLVLKARKLLKQNRINLVGIVWNKVKPDDVYGKYTKAYHKYYKS